MRLTIHTSMVRIIPLCNVGVKKLIDEIIDQVVDLEIKNLKEMRR